MSEKVVVTKSKLDTLANSINELSGETGRKTIDQLTETVNNTSRKLDVNGNGSNLTVDFESAAERAPLETGKTLSETIGKISKWFSDIGSLAFKSVVTEGDMDPELTSKLSDASLFIAKLTGDGTESSPYVCDKTVAEMDYAVAVGKIPIIVRPTMSQVFLPFNVSAAGAFFVNTNPVGGVQRIVIANNGRVVLADVPVEVTEYKVTTISAESTDTQYPSAKCVWDAIPHAIEKTDDMTREVGMDTNGKLWTYPSGKTYTGTLLSSEWVNTSVAGSTDSYMAQSVQIDGLKATYAIAPVVDLSLSGSDAVADKELAEAWAVISPYLVVKTNLNTLRFLFPSALDTPAVNIPIQATIYEKV